MYNSKLWRVESRKKNEKANGWMLERSGWKVVLCTWWKPRQIDKCHSNTSLLLYLPYATTLYDVASAQLSIPGKMMFSPANPRWVFFFEFDTSLEGRDPCEKSCHISTRQKLCHMIFFNVSRNLISRWFAYH